MTLPAKTNFGDYVRDTRERLKSKDRSFSLRQVAQRVGIQPTYLSKMERGELPPPSEETAKRIAVDLGLDAEFFLPCPKGFKRAARNYMSPPPAINSSGNSKTCRMMPY